MDVVAPGLQGEQAGDEGEGVPRGGLGVREESGHQRTRKVLCLIDPSLQKLPSTRSVMKCRISFVRG
jgi:hypothetical protein